MASRKSNDTTNALSFENPSFLILCNDVITGTDQAISLIKLIDQLAPLALPLRLTNCFLVAELKRNECRSIAEYQKAALSYKIKLTNPLNQTIDLGSFASTAIDEQKPWSVNRLILNLAGITLPEEGNYIFQVFAKTKKSDYIGIMSKTLLVKLVGGLSGFYKATFSTSDNKKSGQGNVVLLPNGTIQGADAGFQYYGHYKTHKDRVSASIHATRQNNSVESIFGDLSEFDVEIEGKVDKKNMHLSGTLKDLGSHTQFKITLDRQAPPIIASPRKELKQPQ